MSTQAMLTRVSEPAVMASAVGSMPTTMVKVVMNMGLSRVLPASMRASLAVKPRSIRVKV